jgi:O-antigen ligase
MLNFIYALMVLSVVGVTFSVALSSIAMGSAILLMIVSQFLPGTKKIPRTGFEFLFLAYLCCEILATLFSPEPLSSLVNMKRFFLISLVYLASFTVDSPAKLLGALACFIGAASLVSLLEVFSLSTSGGHFLRVSLFQYFMTEGGIKMFALLLAVPFIIHPGTPRGWRIAAAAAAVPLLVGLVLTQTRSSWFGFLSGAALVGIVRSRYVLLLLVLLVVMFLLFAPADYRARAASIFDPTLTSNLTRIQMIATGWRMFLDRPLTGWGDIDLRKYYVTYIVPLDTAEGGHLHNNLMMLLVTLGIGGFAATMAIFVRIFTRESAAYRATNGDWLLGSASLGALTACLGFHVNGLFEWNFGDHEIAVLLWFTLGIALAARKLSSAGGQGVSG